MKPKTHVLNGTGTLEVSITDSGQVGVEQYQKDGDHFICLSPSDIPEFVRYLTMAAQEAQRLTRPSASQLAVKSSVRICERTLGQPPKPIYEAFFHACAVKISPNGTPEIQIGCTPKHLPQPNDLGIDWVHEVVIRMDECLFREVALNGLQLLEHKPSVIGN